MGLDMYMEGRTFVWKNREKRDGFEVKGRILELAYWRKHPDLHGFIVNTFADGKDDCQDIPLTAENIETIIMAVEGKELPHTEGFFFGSSSYHNAKEDVVVLRKVLAWLENVPVIDPLGKGKKIGGLGTMHVVDIKAIEQMEESREVVYRASW